MEDLSKKPLVDIIHEMTYLDQEIETMYMRRDKKERIDKKKLKKLILLYEKNRLEVIKRFPMLKDDEAFESKRKRKVKENDNDKS